MTRWLRHLPLAKLADLAGQRLVTIGAFLLVGVFATSADAQVEQWCANNPSVCVCSRTFQATDRWTQGQSGFWGQASESTASTICGPTNNNGHRTIFLSGGEPPQQVIGGGPATGRNATRLTYTMTMWPASTSGFAGRRIGVRYYHWWSGSYQSTGGSCTNDKYTQIGDYLTAYASGFSNSNNGSGVTPTTGPNAMRGKWGMIEHYIRVYGNGSTQHEYYFTDLSTGTVSTNVSPSRLSNGGDLQTTDVIHKYRQDSCPGDYRVAYAVMASWPAGGSQRIPAASEVGGGTTPTPPPAAPSNLKISFTPSPLAGSWQLAAARALDQRPPFTRDSLPWAGAGLLVPLAALVLTKRRE